VHYAKKAPGVAAIAEEAQGGYDQVSLSTFALAAFSFLGRTYPFTLPNS
jgi:hypothetical protein